MENNSLVQKEQQKKPSFEERKKNLQQFDNVKQVKKKEPNAFVAWITKMFFSGRSVKEICLDIAENQLVPGFKDNAYNSITSFIASVIYRDHKTTAGGGAKLSSGNPSGSFITNYVSYSDKKKQQEQALADNQKKEEETVKQGFEYPAFENDPPGVPNRKTALQKAREFLGMMHEAVNPYDTLSVLELSWMMKKTVDYTWDKYGWDKEEILAIQSPTHINNPKTPYIIELPKAHVLN